MTTEAITLLRQRMIEDMTARKLNPHTQRGHIYSCKRFSAWLKRSPDTATPDEVRQRLFSCYDLAPAQPLFDCHNLHRSAQLSPLSPA